MKVTQTIGKAEAINLFSLKTPQMRAFHLTWMAFLISFFAWFAIAPLMAVVREEFNLTKSQIGNIIIASVSITIFARLLIGWICDKIGPRITYSVLLIVGAIPVIMIGFSHSYETFIIARLAIGAIGASFVITQYHTSAMFGSNVIGSANAIAAGWGNLGGGLAQIIMPLIFAGFVALGFTNSLAWRYSMIIPGAAMILMGFIYYKFTQDTPEGNFKDIKRNSEEGKKNLEPVKIGEILKDRRVWILFFIYGCSFGVEITIDNIAALYFKDTYGLSLATAGILAGIFGFMNIFARALGGIISDKVNKTKGLRGRTWVLGTSLFLAGLGIVMFSRMNGLVMAVVSLVIFALFVKMGNGATYSVVPYMNKRAIGMVSGIVGAGGNLGAMLMGFVLKMEGVTYQHGLMYIGMAVSLISLSAFFIVPRLSLSDNLDSTLQPEIIPVPVENGIHKH
ncbi:MAG: NarK family nitrate/nitrite MFS transporter [Prolixibacteraceae bacterium]|nr:NarK family nitrate/nitrite MFS transporter [Prolixibacteraceae bacterium]